MLLWKQCRPCGLAARAPGPGTRRSRRPRLHNWGARLLSVATVAADAHAPLRAESFLHQDSAWTPGYTPTYDCAK